MTLKEQLLITTDAYCSAKGMSQARLSTILFSGGARLQQIRDGSDVATGRFESVMQWLSNNWPEGAIWPEGIKRPEPVLPEAAE
jgi:hypothetical protein